MAISPKIIKGIIELELHSSEITIANSIIRIIDDYLKTHFLMKQCIIDFNLFDNWLKQISANRRAKVIDFIVKEYNNVGWTIKVENNYFAFYE